MEKTRRLLPFLLIATISYLLFYYFNIYFIITRNPGNKKGIFFHSTA